MSFYKKVAKKLVHINNVPYLMLEDMIKIVAEIKETSVEDEVKKFHQERKGIIDIKDMILNDFDEYEEVKD